MSIQELNRTARDLMSVRQMIEELQAEAEALTDKLKAAMVDQDAEVLQGDGWKATWKNVNSSRFDSKAFKADHPVCPQRMRRAPCITAGQSTMQGAAGQNHGGPGAYSVPRGPSDYKEEITGND